MSEVELELDGPAKLDGSSVSMSASWSSVEYVESVSNAGCIRDC